MGRDLKSSELLKILIEDIEQEVYAFKEEGQSVEDYVNSVKNFKEKLKNNKKTEINS